MSRPMIRIHNLANDEIIDREMNDQEFAQWEIDKAKAESEQAEVEAKAEAKAQAQAKLSTLGLSVEDLIALGL